MVMKYIEASLTDNEFRTEIEMQGIFRSVVGIQKWIRP